MLVHRRVTPSIKFAGTHLYTWVERGTVRVKCLAQEHNTMPPASARTRSTRSGVERANHEATAPRDQEARKKFFCYYDHVHTSLKKLENAALFLRSGLPSTLICYKNGAFRKRFPNRRSFKTPELPFVHKKSF